MILVSWAVACVFGALWWHYLRSGHVHSPGGYSQRAHDPFSYWFAMSLLGAGVVVALGLALYSTFALG